ncbi:MAG: hypothetical protein HQL38_02555 [Alphaproteobacteria bacterium]|nr:hypothetical protein [Alphaproteobacteria bacterium]MBF0391539.1 hypothetical protein [Alphaproteobacteria bacterium]
MRRLAVLPLLCLLWPLPAHAESWTRAVPAELKGEWASSLEGCADRDARRLQFFDAGFRWVRNRENRGLNRGLFQKESGAILFRSTDEKDDQPDWRLRVAGATLVRERWGLTYSEFYVRCPE